MGTEGLWIPLVLSAVSAGTSYVNQRNQRKRADRVALDSLRSNTQRQKRADEVTQKLIADTGASAPEAERKTVMDGFLQQLQKSRSGAQAGLQRRGGESEAFARDAEAAALGVDTAGREYADLASRLDSPFRQRRNEARMVSDAGLDIGLVGREQQGEDRVRDMRLRGIRGNPWLEALSAVAGGAASAYSGGRGGGATAASAGSFAPSSNAMLDGALGSSWGGGNSLVWGNYGGLR